MYRMLEDRDEGTSRHGPGSVMGFPLVGHSVMTAAMTAGGELVEQIKMLGTSRLPGFHDFNEVMYCQLI